MKQIIFSILVSLLICSCKNSNDEVVCKKNGENDPSFSSEIIGVLNNNKIISIDARMTFESKEDMNTWCEFFNMDVSGEEKNKNIICKDKNITIKHLEEEGTLKGVTKEDFISSMSYSGYSCK